VEESLRVRASAEPYRVPGVEVHLVKLFWRC
jgi:hypothetical protein